MLLLNNAVATAAISVADMMCEVSMAMIKIKTGKQSHQTQTKKKLQKKIPRNWRDRRLGGNYISQKYDERTLEYAQRNSNRNSLQSKE